MPETKTSPPPVPSAAPAGPTAAGQPAKVDVASLGPLKSYIGFQLRRAQDLSFQVFARRVGDEDLSPGRFAILSVVHENPGINQTVLGAATGRDKSTLTPALRDLERRGFLLKERSETDRRAYRLALTDAGRRHLDALTAHAQAHDRVLDSIVGEHHKPLFIHLLERLVEGLGQQIEDPS